MRATTRYRPPFWYALKNKEEHKMMYGDSIRSKYCKCTALYFVVLPCNLRWRLFSFFFLFISKLKEVEIVGCPAGKHTRLSFKALIGFLCCVSTQPRPLNCKAYTCPTSETIDINEHMKEYNHNRKQIFP